jgi:flagellar hook assembly protein FlgD
MKTKTMSRGKMTDSCAASTNTKILSNRCNPIHFRRFFIAVALYILSTSILYASDLAVTWTNAVGVSVNGNSITKTGATGAWDGGASSAATFAGNGGVDFIVPQTNAHVMCGLSNSDPDQSNASIPYGIWAQSGGAIAVYEYGVQRGIFGTYLAGDHFQVERIGTAVNYKKNGTIFYTSPLSSTGMLMVDSSIFTMGGSIGTVITTGFTPAIPDAINNLSAFPGNSTEVQLVWSAPANNGGAITRYEVQYGTVASGQFASTFIDDAVPGATISGLTNGTQYQFRVIAVNSFGNSPVSNVVQATPNLSSPVTWTNAVGVTVSGSTITKTGANGAWNSGASSTATFIGNGGVDFTVTQTNANVLCGLSNSDPDQSNLSIGYGVFAGTGGSIIIYESGNYINISGAYQAGDHFQVERVGTTVSYKRNGTVFYTSSSSSTGILMVDSSLYTTGGAITNAKLTGFTPGPPNLITDLSALPGNSTEVQLVWSAPANNGGAITRYEVQYGTVASGQFASTFIDDANTGATITGLTNGTAYQFRVVAVNSFGTSPVSNVAQATPNLSLPVTWTNAVGVTVSGSTITKTGANGAWNSGASSIANFAGNGGVDFTVTQTNTNVLCGLSNSDPDQSNLSISYGVFAGVGGAITLYESGNYINISGAYQAGDHFQVERVGTTVYYKRNGTIFYTSSAPSTGILMVDSSLYTTGGAITNAKLTGFTPGPADTITNLSALPGNSTEALLTWSMPANNGGAITRFEVQYGTVASGQFASTFIDDAVPGATISGLTNGTQYQFRVVAVNSFGTSVPSNVQTVTPIKRTVVNSDITSNTTWTVQGSPYAILNNINVTSGNTLTINPGATVQFNGNYYLAVAGTLLAQGQLGNPILFTSGQTTVAQGDWQYISLSSTSVMDYAQVEYSNQGLLINNASPVISHSIIRYNNNGIYISNGSVSSITHNKISRNDYGIFIVPTLSNTLNPAINFNDIYDNTIYNFYNQITGSVNFSALTINAENNWWGTTNLSAIAAKIYDQADNPNSPLVDINPIAQGSDTIAITAPSVSPMFFDPRTTSTVGINYTLDKPANVTIKIYRHSPNQLVKTLFESQPRTVGAHTENWDGKNDAGVDLPNEEYYYTIYAVDSLSHFGQYDPLYVPGTVTMQNPTLTPSNFDSFKGETSAVTYNLTQPAYVTIKIGQTTMWTLTTVVGLNRVLVDNQPRNAGNQSEIWDGRNDSGNLILPDTYLVYGWTTLIRDNGIIINRSTPVLINSVTTNPYAITPTYNEAAQIQYVVLGSTNINVKIKDPNGNLVKTLVNNQPKTAGTYNITWFGDNSNGQKLINPGDYLVVVEETNGTLILSSKVANVSILK